MKITPKARKSWIFLPVLALLFTGFLNDLRAQAESDSSQTSKRDYFKIGYQYDIFDRQLSDWNAVNAEMGINRKSWTLIPRLTFAQRFDKEAFYGELDSYKTFRNNNYLNINLGYSGSDIFPESKIHLEYFNPFGSWEHSVGIGLYTFQQTGSLYFATASLSKYYGRFLTIARVNAAVAERNNNFTNFSVQLQDRYYLNEQAFLGLNLAYGYDNTLFIISDLSAFTNEDPYLISAGAFYQSQWNQRLKWRLSYDWTYYDFVFFNRNQHSFNVSLYYQLKK